MVAIVDRIVGNVRDRFSTVKSSLNLAIGSSGADAVLNQVSGFGQNNRDLLGLRGKRAFK